MPNMVNHKQLNNSLTSVHQATPLRFARNNPSDHLRIQRNANVPEEFETFIRNTADSLDNPLWKKFITLGKSWKVRLSKTHDEGLPFYLKPFIKLQTKKINDDPVLIERGVYVSSKGSVNKITGDMTLAQMKHTREKNQTEPTLKPIETDFYPELLTHEATHVLDRYFGKTRFVEAVKSKAIYPHLITGALLTPLGLLIPIIGLPITLFGLLQLYMGFRNYNSFSNHPDFIKVVKSDKLNIIKNIPEEFKGIKPYKKLAQYYNKPAEALAHAATALYMDPNNKRTIMCKKMYPQVTEYIKKFILPKMTECSTDNS